VKPKLRVNETYNHASKAGKAFNENSQSPLPWPIEMRPPQSLRAAKRNARTHSKKQIQQIHDSMARFGVINPVVADDKGHIIAGHARVEAAKLLNLKQIPVIRASHLSEAEIRAYTLADNKIAANAGWNREILALEFSELQVTLPEIGVDIGITGFEPGEIDGLMIDFADTEANSGDQIPEVEDNAVARTDDLFILGNHRLLVGDARSATAFERLMQGETAEMAFLDPPYNVRIGGHVGGRGRTKHREFACASGEMSSAQFVRFLEDALGLCARHTASGAISLSVSIGGMRVSSLKRATRSMTN
jgi:ParB-like nuclease family protein